MNLLSGHAERIGSIAISGYYVALRVGFSFPSEELNRLPEEWVDFYTREGFVVQDPVMRWVYANTGAIRWSEINLPDPAGVLKAAAANGLNYGAVVSATGTDTSGKRSYGSFLRHDREFTDAEIAELSALICRLHDESGQQLALTAAEIEALELQSRGLRQKQIASELRISMSAVKARLSNAKRKLGAATPSQAASIAKSRGIL